MAALAAAMGLLVQCKPYDDAWIKEELTELKEQVANLRKSVDALDAYRTLLDKSRLISEVKDHGDGTFTIYFADGTPPVTLDAGRGEPGQDGVTPDFKIADGNWYVSYDGGVTWNLLGSASGGDDFFKNVYLDGDYLVLVLIDGTQVKINLKGGQGGSQGGDEPSGATPRSYWSGDWVIGPAGFQFDVSIVESGSGFSLCWGTDVKIPLEYEEATGNLLLKMPENRWIGASADGDNNYYLNMYDKSGSRTKPDPEQGALLCTIARESDDVAVFTPGDSNYNGFYARPYSTSQGKWGTSTFWFDVESGLTRKGGGGGGGGETGVPTKADWLGTWKSSAGNIVFYESGGAFMCYAPDSNFGNIGIQFTFHAEDGTASYIDAGYYGWCGTGSDNAYYYYAPYKGNESLYPNQGDVILRGTLSEDKQTLTLTSGMDGVTRVLWYTGSTWGDKPSNWLGTWTR